MNTGFPPTDASWNHADGSLQAISSFEIKTLADEVCTELSREPETARVKFVIHSPSALPLALRAEKAMIRRVLKIVLLAAVDSVGRAGGIVRISFRASAAFLCVCIEDNGRGIDPALCVKVGPPLESPASLLRTVQRELADTGARLDLQSRLGVGSRNSILLPRVDSTNWQFKALSRADDFRSRGPNSQLS